MLLGQLLVTCMGILYAGSLLWLGNYFIFRKSISGKRSLLINGLIGLVFGILYGLELFVVEKESIGTSLTMGVREFMSDLPLFLFMFTFFLAVVVYPLSVVVNALVASRKRKSN